VAGGVRNDYVDTKRLPKSMVIMDSVKLAITDTVESVQIPSGWCLMALLEGKETLHLGITPNAWQRYNYLKDRSMEDAGIAELFSSATHISFQSMPTALDALIALKANIHESRPRLQNSFRPWQHYVYLAINAYSFPFIRISSDTNDDWQYLGPFRDRFFLTDALDAVCRILRLPRCETGAWPCDKLDNGLCSGYCLSLNEVDAGQEHSLQKLDDLLKESLTHPNNGILEMLKHERDKYFDDLEFIKADLLDEEITLQDKYRDWLVFLYAARKLQWEDEHLLVEKGRIRCCRYLGKDYLFAPDVTSYRENESLALNLDSVDESRILYEHYHKKIKG